MITAVFKNLIDWLSRLYKPVLGDKPVLLLSTSTGSNGGRSSLEHLAGILPRWGGKVSALFSLADFDSSFDQGLARIRDPRADQALQQAVKLFRNSL